MIAARPTADSTAQRRPFFQFMPAWGAGASLFLASLTLFGWVSGRFLLASVRANFIPMAPSTAICFGLLAGALLLSLRRPEIRRSWFVRALETAVLAIGMAKLMGGVVGTSGGLDSWLVKNPDSFGQVLTGRMAPLTAVSFVATAAAMLALTSPRHRHVTGPLAALTTVLNLVVLAGYAYGTPVLYGGAFVPVALTTACAFVSLCVAVIATAGEETWPIRSFLGGSTRAILLRTFVPILALLALVDGWVRARVLEDRSINPAIASAMSAVALTGLLLWVIGMVSRKVGARIDAAESERNLAKSDLLALNAQLEDRVWQRTRELRERHEQMGEELRMARELQFALLPHEYPRVAVQDNAEEGALEFLSFFVPSGDVSGDFFTVFPIGPKAAGVIICDVMGHGVRAALITGMVRALVEEHSHAVSDPGDLLTHINEGLTAILRQAGTTMFATCFCLVADVGRREFRYANAGHPQPIRVRRQPGSVKADWLPRSEPSGPAMGLFPQAAYRTMSCQMAAGDLVAMYTDGLFEVENTEGDLLTQEDLLKLVRQNADEPAEELLAHLVTEVRTISRSTSFDDDVCVVGAQVKAEAFSGLEDRRAPGFATSFA